MSNTRPIALINSQFDKIPQSYEALEFRGDDLGGPNVIFKGYARPGGDVTQPVWQISKYTYNASNNVTSIQWPVNSLGVVSNDYEFIWNNRALLTFV